MKAVGIFFSPFFVCLFLVVVSDLLGLSSSRPNNNASAINYLLVFFYITSIKDAKSAVMFALRQLRQQMVLFDKEPEVIEELPLPEVPQEKPLPGQYTAGFSLFAFFFLLEWVRF